FVQHRSEKVLGRLAERPFLFVGTLLDRAQLDNVIRLVDDVTAPVGMECIEVEYNKHGSVLRLFVDWVDPSKAARAVNLDDCVAINNLLDADGRLDGLID